MSNETKSVFRVIREKGVAKVLQLLALPTLQDQVLRRLPSLRGQLLRRRPDSFLWGPVDRWTSKECETTRTLSWLCEPGWQ